MESIQDLWDSFLNSFDSHAEVYMYVGIAYACWIILLAIAIGIFVAVRLRRKRKAWKQMANNYAVLAHRVKEEYPV